MQIKRPHLPEKKPESWQTSKLDKMDQILAASNNQSELLSLILGELKKHREKTCGICENHAVECCAR